MTPTGSVIMLLTTDVPDGFLLCDGSTISRTTYKNLFDVIGVTYGAGDGNLTFQLPDFIAYKISNPSFHYRPPQHRTS